MTKREKRLIIGCSIFLLMAAYILYFLIPQLRSFEQLKKGIGESSQSYMLNKIYSERLQNLDQEENKLVKQLSTIRQHYPPIMRQSDILFTVYTLASESGLKITGVSILDMIPVIPNSNSGAANTAIAATVSGTAVPDGQVKIKDPKMSELVRTLGLGGNGEYNAATATFTRQKISNGQGFVVPVKITAAGNDTQVKSFFFRLNNLPNQVLVKDYSLILKEPNVLEIEATLSFYGIADSYAEIPTLFKDTRREGESGSPVNLFSGSLTAMMAGTSTGDTIETPLAESQLLSNLLDGYDFSMRVVPYGNGMAPATVTLAARRLVNQDKSAVIYGDNQREERVDLVITENAGRFYCKYRTRSESFPDKNYQETVEFKPKSRELKFIIDSTPRKFKEDLASVNLVIVNNTSLRLLVTEMNDDTLKPRLKVTVTTGKYKILRNSPQT